MKLIAPGRLPVQTLGRRAPAQREKAGEIALRSIQRDVEHVRNITGKRHKQQSGLFVQKTMGEFDAQWKGPEFFHVDELPQEVVTEGMRMKGRVLAAEVYPEMYKRAMESAINEASLIIEDGTFRSEWVADANGVAVAANSRNQVKANKDISKQIFEDQKLNYQNALSRGDPRMALAIVKDMRESATGSDEELKFLELKAKKAGETNTYEEFMVAEDVTMMAEFVQFLKDEKNYRKNGGELDDGERLLWKHKLETEINRINRVNSSLIKSEKKMIEREVKITIQNLLDGNASDLDQIADLVNRSTKAKVSPATIQNLRTALQFASANDNQNKMSRFDRDEFADTFIKRSNLKDFEKVELKRRLDESNNRQISKENNDTMQAASDAGFVKLSPIDAERPNELAMQFKLRKQQMDIVQENYEIFNDDMLTKAEAASISSRVNLLPAGDKIKYLQATTFAMGEDAALLYDQLNIDGTVGSLAIAGITSIYGTEDQSRAIIMGGEYLKNNKEEANQVNKNLDPRTRKELGTAFYYAGGTQSAVKDAVKNAYVHYVLSSGGDILSSGVDDDAYDKAIRAATGGMISFGFDVIQTPAYGVTQNDFEDWIERIDPKYIDELGGVAGMSSERFLSTLKDENFKLVGDGHGQYIVTRNDTTPLENQTKGGSFRLIYDPDKVLAKKKRKHRNIFYGD